ncbi:DUF6123 family protein [Litchfieldia alkalitelluris]|uniref:DUF6123 family protein n=1 Tax=Litchfieldia alkalitelluris TaxID=304268 RepID=UPI001F4357DF|nr:DUF6123 family protein [Litchfieldia alkalitelluris]
MVKSVTTVNEYLDYLTSKGFQLGEDALGFIAFGQHYTGSSDELVNTALEITLKAQKEFDGSFFVSLLEMFKENQVTKRKEGLQIAFEKGIMK